jgi:hypothetical protein
LNFLGLSSAAAAALAFNELVETSNWGVLEKIELRDGFCRTEGACRRLASAVGHATMIPSFEKASNADATRSVQAVHFAILIIV